MRWGIRRWWLAVAGFAALVAHAQPVLDLSGWNPQDGPRALDGPWEFAAGRLLSPTEAWPADAQVVDVPHEWSGGAGPRRGAGTYRVSVRCDGTQALALALTFQHSAARVFVNGQLVAEQGVPGLTREDAQPSVKQQIQPLPAQACPMHVLVQVSNWDLYRGGFVRSILLGTPQQLAQRHEDLVLRVQTAQGALLFAALFGFAFYLRRRRERGALLFSVFAVSIAMTLSLGGERAHGSLAEYVSFDAFMRVIYLNWFFSLGTFPWVLEELYRREGSRRFVRAFTLIAVAGGIFSIATPAHVVTWTTPALAAASAVVSAYVVFVLLRALAKRRSGAAVLLGGLGVFGVAVFNDILVFQRISATALMPYGILAIVLAPAVLMAQRFSQALSAEELRTLEQRERADLLLRSTRAGVLDWDGTTHRQSFSDRLREMLGLPLGPDAPEPPPFGELVHPEDRERIDASFRAQLRDRSVKSGVRGGDAIEYRLRRSDGEWLWMMAESIFLCDAQGRTLRFITSLIDITERKRHEAEMVNRLKFINDLFDSVPIGLALRDPNGKYLFVNRAWEHNIGMARDQVLGMSLQGVDVPEAKSALALDREALEMPPGEVIAPREVDAFGRRFMQTRTVMVDALGERIGVLVASVDITDKHATELALATEQKRLELVVRGARVGIVDWDGVTHVTYYSPRFREIRGYAPDADTTGWPDYFKVMIHPEDRARITKRWVTFIRGQGPEGPKGEFYSPEEYRLLQADGNYVWVEVSGMAVRDERGFVTRWIAAIIDITERHSQREALRAQNETLKENVRLREEVERIGRHDIKTPLNSIVAVPRLLREERRLGPEADELLGIVERAGYRILSMVNLSLDLYKMEQGSYIFRPDAVDLEDLVGKVLADVRMHAASKHVALQVRVGGVKYVWAEELLCYSLLANLLKNAVEASPEGATVTVRAESGPAGTVQIHLHNDGVVPESIREHFFEKYATLGKASGTGLGTYSARLMARVQDGDITMRTSGTEGTTLSVLLRAAPAGAMPATVRHAAERRVDEPLSIHAARPVHVLLVDDDEYNLLIVRRFLPSPPFNVMTAINGRVALGAAEMLWPDVIFMDLDMPVMGGLEAVQELRAMEQRSGARRCTMIALSSHEDEETRRAALAAGFDRYLTKPVTREVVHDTVLQLEGVSRGEQGGAASMVAPIRVAGIDDPVYADRDVENILADFITSRRELVRALAGAMSAGERPEVRRIAHQLAGSLALYGFHWASDQARFIEKHSNELEPARVSELAARMERHLETAEVRYRDA